MSVERLFVYGSLQPGHSNAHLLSAAGGDWQPAVIHGTLLEAGWGAGIGYPGLMLDESGEEVHGQMLASEGLAAIWDDLDRFEGPDYERVLASARLEGDERVSCYVYAVAPLDNS